MELALYLLEGSINFIIATVPLIILFLQKKVFKLEIKVIGSCLVLNLLVSIFFWVKLKDINLMLYQSVPYILSFTYILAEYLFQKRKESKKDSVE